MTNLISWPFRLTYSGAVATRDDSDETYYAEELTQLVQTRPDERTLTPTYGIPDAAFQGWVTAALQSAVVNFGPAVVIEEISIDFLSDVQQDVRIAFASAPTNDSFDPLLGALSTGVTYADS